MSGSTVPPSATPGPVPLPPGRSDLATDVDRTIRLFCEKAEGATEVLPFGLSDAAAKEVRSFCTDVTRRADRYTGDLQAVALARWDLVSNDTKKELAQLASRAASPYRAPPSDGRQDPIVDVATVTRGAGKQFKLGVPVKFASHTDVKLLINYDYGRLTKLDPKFLGAGAEVTQPFSWGKVDGAVLVDTSRGVPDYSGFIRISIDLP